MLEENGNIATIKHEVLRKVAKIAFAGEMDGKQDDIPFELIPGPSANFRCCIYKEREIIRQRVRLARGLSPTANKDNKNIVQVINSACEGCPITRFVVTDNCQKCMSKKCQEACRFGSITMLRDRAYVDPSHCKECGKCTEACPYNAIADLMRPCKRSCPVDAIIMDENNIVVINEDKCIHCGACIKDCPFGAISDRSFMVDVINIMRNGSIPIYAMTAPAGEGQFGTGVTMGMVSQGLKDMGFNDVYEVALGGDLVAASEAEELAEKYKAGKKMTTSCCPAFVNMIKKHYPQVLENMSTTVSPMAAVSRLIKTMHPGAMTVFIGPCIAKKSEVLDSIGKDSADYALTFEELSAMFKAKDIDLESYSDDSQQGSIYGKRFGNAGGVAASVVEALKEKEENIDVKIRGCNGAAECKKGLLLLKVGKLPEDFIEGMICVGGCVNGPGSIKNELAAKKDREALLAKADKRGIYENLDEYKDFEFSMHRKH